MLLQGLKGGLPCRVALASRRALFCCLVQLEARYSVMIFNLVRMLLTTSVRSSCSSSNSAGACRQSFLVLLEGWTLAKLDARRVEFASGAEVFGPESLSCNTLHLSRSVLPRKLILV